MVAMWMMLAVAQAGPPVVMAGGLRNTVSAFDGAGQTGLGGGGQLRVRIGDRVGSEWFADAITAPVDGGGRRVDDHIGWSLMLYPTRASTTKTVVPYLLAGHCFDYSKLVVPGARTQDRWSSAIQGGLGGHLNLSRAFDVSLSGQYMLHLGDHHLVVPSDGHRSHDHQPAHRGGSLEGHLLVNLSVNFRFKNPEA
jgi:hypothetical protein